MEKKLHPFRSSLPGKILLGFLLSATALTAGYVVHHTAFAKIVGSLQRLSEPNEKLQIVNRLFSEITRSGEHFRSVSAGGQQHSIQQFVQHGDTITLFLDSLKVLCHDNPGQMAYLDTIYHALEKREQLLLDYIRFRQALLYGNPVAAHLNKLDSMLAGSIERTDSLYHTYEEKITRVTTPPPPAEEERRKFLANLFRKQKTPEVTDTLIQEEHYISIDTVITARQDTMFNQAREIIAQINEDQRVRRQAFYRREAALADFEKTFNTRVFLILIAIEHEVISLADAALVDTGTIVQRTARNVGWIMSLFLILTAIVVFLIIIDITRSNSYRKQLEKAKEEAEQHSLARQRFLSNMSHEIRTPLQSIIGFSEQSMQRKEATQDEVEAIHASSMHLLQVVNEILDYSKISSGQLAFVESVIDVHDVIDEVVRMLNPQAAMKGLDLRYVQETMRPFHVTGDGFRLRQILLNLVGNAIKFTTHGAVVIRFASTSSQAYHRCTFSVTDTGMGIPAHLHDRIFDRFEQVDSADGRQISGTGLGLSIVKALTEAQSGKVSVSSVPGEGSTFSVVIPYRIPSAESIRAAQTVPAIPAEQQCVVWVLDDDALILRLCGSILSKYGIVHTCFSKGQAVVDALEHGRSPHLLIMDIRLPDMHGGFLLEKLRKHKETEFPVVAFTAMALPEERERLFSRGFDDILLKPFVEAEFVEMIRRHTTSAFASRVTSRKEESFEFASAFLGGDPDTMREIMQQYITDTHADITQLGEALARRDLEQIRFLLHRVAGRTAQIGAKKQGAALRRLEVEFRNTEKISQFAALQHSMEEVKELIAEMQERLIASDDRKTVTR